MAEAVAKNAAKPAKTGGKSVGFRWLWIAVAAAVIVIGIVTPSPEAIGYQGKMSLILMLAAIILWVTEAMPVSITALAIMALIPLLGIVLTPTTYAMKAGEVTATTVASFASASFDQVWKASINSTILFLVGVWAFTAYLNVSTVADRLVIKVLDWAQHNSKKALLGFMLVGCIISCCMSNIALTAIVMGLATGLLEANGCKVGESGLGKCMAVGIPIAVMLGGLLLPCGTPINVLIMGFLTSNPDWGININFLQWFLIAVIPVFVCLFASWWGLCKVYKPEAITDDALAWAAEKKANLQPMEGKEKANIAIILITLVLWVLSSWVPVLNTTAVALLALFCMFLPGIAMIDMKEYIKDSPWGLLLMLMAVNAIVGGMTATTAGATMSGAKWLVTTCLGGAAAMGPIPLLIIASILGAILHNVIPAGPALAGLLTPTLVPLIVTAGGTGGEVAAMVMICAVWSADAFLLPLDAVPLVTYPAGWYKFNEMWKGGIVPTIVMIICSVALFVPVSALLGLS